MAAPMSYSSSSSSDEDEELAKLKEAVDSSNNFLNIQSTNVRTSGQTIQVNERKCVGTRQENGTPQGFTCHDLPPSRRPDKEVVEDEVRAYFPQTTPGFRKHVARKLSESLDSFIAPVTDGFKTKPMKVSTPEGIRLFCSSKAYISAVTEVTQQVRKRKVSSSSDSSAEDERLKEATISHDQILEQKDVPYFTNQKPADIIVSNPAIGKATDDACVSRNGQNYGENVVKTDDSGTKDLCKTNDHKKKKKKNKHKHDRDTNKVKG